MEIWLLMWKAFVCVHVREEESGLDMRGLYKEGEATSLVFTPFLFFLLSLCVRDPYPTVNVNDCYGEGPSTSLSSSCGDCGH